MDLVTSHGSPYSDSDHPAESDNFPNGLESNGSRESLNPSRPSSRLGFNRTILSPISPGAPSDSEAIQWSHSLFQNVGISNLRLSSIKPHPQAKEDSMDPVFMKESAVENVDNALSSSHSSPSHDAHDHVSNNLSRSPAVSRKPLKGSPPPVSRLCFPFVTTLSPRHKKQSAPPPPPPPPPPSPPPPTRHKYSCFPSLMSPASPGRAFPKHERHNYRQHGYSRTALQQVKWFWSTREEESEDHAHRHEAPTPTPREAVPPIGCPFLPTTHPSSSNAPTPKADVLPQEFPQASQALPPMSVHPRRGDIKALRDPYAVHIDRAFVDIPTWTIGKALWMVELHLATDKRVSGSQNNSEEDSYDGDSDNELEMSASTGFSDDSDATLVESESETELPNIFVRKPLDKPQKDLEIRTTLDASASSTMTTQETTSNRLINQNLSGNSNWLQSKSKVSVIYGPPSNPSRARKRKWAINWYQRWEILADLSRQEQDPRHALKTKATPLVTLPLVHNTRRLFSERKSTDPDDNLVGHSAIALKGYQGRKGPVYLTRPDYQGVSSSKGHTACQDNGQPYKLSRLTRKQVAYKAVLYYNENERIERL